MNFGCGWEQKFPGWINVDLKVEAAPDVIANLGRGLPFASACADFIYTESFIEELSLAQGRNFLRECRRIIKPGGVMRLLTADLEKFARSYLQQPDWLVETWDITTGVPRETSGACEVVNLGIRLAGTFFYDRPTFRQIAGECGFRVEDVEYKRSSEHAELRDLDIRCRRIGARRAARPRHPPGVRCRARRSSIHIREMTNMHQKIQHAPTILRRPQVEQRTGLSRSTLYHYIKDGDFPKPVQLGLRAVGWPERTSAYFECADDDCDTPGNPGLTHARQAALAVGGLLAIPDFGPDRPAGASDFNDLHRHRGPSAVLTAVRAAGVPSVELTGVEDRAGRFAPAWPDHEPLTEPLDPLPYPADALPPLLRDAVREAQAFVQAPVALVACSALAALSLATQGLVNVRRDHQLAGPVSLYLLAVADSGERKTTCDAIFSPALRDWESDRLTAIAPDLAARDAALAAFEAKKAGILDAIRHKRRRSQDTAKNEGELDALAREAPPTIAVPRLLYADATPEALAHALATRWPTRRLIGRRDLIGAHGMGYDTILRNLALLNVLWDGGTIAIDRRSKPSFQLRDRRLTFGLMAQPEALRGFLERAGTLPRGTGFIARFLIAWPASTQGTRAYRLAPAAARGRRSAGGSRHCSTRRSPPMPAAD